MDYESQSNPSMPYGCAGDLSAATRHRVLRNTYALPALSMVPTLLGARIGVKSGFSFFAGSPFIGFVAFMAIAFTFFFAIEKFKNSGVGVALLLGFTFFIGLMLSRLIGHMLGFSNGAQLIMTAFGGTAAIVGAMATVATVSKCGFTGMGKFPLRVRPRRDWSSARRGCPVRAALLALFMLPAMPAGAQAWVKVDEGVEYDPRSVQVNGSLRQVRVQVDLPVPDPTKMINRLRVLYEFDCKNSLFRTLSVETHTKAARVSKEDETGQWTRITPRHESEVLVRNAVCATPK